MNRKRKTESAFPLYGVDNKIEIYSKFFQIFNIFPFLNGEKHLDLHLFCYPKMKNAFHSNKDPKRCEERDKKKIIVNFDCLHTHIYTIYPWGFV